MGIFIEIWGKVNVSRLSKTIMAQACISSDDKSSINVEHKCIKLQENHCFLS